MRKTTGLALLGATTLAMAASGPALGADLWYLQGTSGTSTVKIGTINADGTAKNDSVATISNNNVYALGATTSHVYYLTSNPFGSAPTGPNAMIRRIDVDGTNDSALVDTGVQETPSSADVRVNRDSLAVSPSHVFWLTWNGGTGAWRLGRANLDGSGVNTSLKTGTIAGAAFLALAVVGDSVFVKPTFSGSRPANSGIMRIADSGAGEVTYPYSAWPATGGGPFGSTAIGGNSTHLFGLAGSRVGRIDPVARTCSPAFATLPSNDQSIAASETHVYATRVAPEGVTAVTVSSATAAGSTPTTLSNLPVANHSIKDIAGTASGSPVAGTAGTADCAATPAPTPTPTPSPTPTPTATTLATPTVNTKAPGRNAVVTVRTQLGPKGKYTFIFERPTSNELSRETQAGARVPMQKGTRLGKRTLRKAYTAAAITTTADNAKVVTRALLRKAQAKKLNLRVIYTPPTGAQTASVITIK